MIPKFLSITSMLISIKTKKNLQKTASEDLNNVQCFFVHCLSQNTYLTRIKVSQGCPFKEKELYIFVYCKNERLLVIITWLSCIQRGLKDTEHKPLCRHYQGVTHAKMIFAVRSLTHAKTLIGRYVNMLLCYRSISSDNFAHCLIRKHDTVNTRDIAWVP
jgi:hypothetical protein